ncbi:MAG: hypothetical protein NT022_03050, partial [Deltaproteobacteria bacterium]|nr:hypothetical protein [Deltaproteobacteria bacterium]
RNFHRYGDRDGNSIVGIISKQGSRDQGVEDSSEMNAKKLQHLNPRILESYSQLDGRRSKYDS